MGKKPARDKRVPIMFTDEELRAIDDYRFEERFGTRADAIRYLVRDALDSRRPIPKPRRRKA